MARVLFIWMLCVITLCRVTVLIAHLAEPSHELVINGFEQESSGEEGEILKFQCEYEEDTWISGIALPGYERLSAGFASLSDNRLLEHTRKPVSPPPNPA